MINSLITTNLLMSSECKICPLGYKNHDCDWDWDWNDPPHQSYHYEPEGHEMLIHPSFLRNTLN